MKGKWCIYLAVFLWGGLAIPIVSAQSDSLDIAPAYNPFELLYRLDKEAQQTLQSAEEKNPFDMAPPAASLLEEIKDAQKYKGQFWVEIARFPGDKDVPKGWLIAFILPILLFLTFLSVVYRSSLEKLYRHFTNDNILAISYRDTRGSYGLQKWLMGIFSISSFALFGFTLFLHQSVNREFFLKAVVVALVLSASYWIVKFFLVAFTKWTFEEQRKMGVYHYAIEQYNYLLAIALLPFSLLLAFAPEAPFFIIQYIALILIGIWWLFRIIKGLQIGFTYIADNIFRFFAYLCTVEIAPIIILITTIQLILGY